MRINSLVLQLFASFILSMILIAPANAHNYKAEFACPQPPTLMSGLYLGGQVGYDSYWVRENINLPAPNDIDGNPKMNAPGWVGGIVLGYGQYIHDYWYLGAEVWGNFSQANESYLLRSSTSTYSAKIDARSTFGIGIMPGLLINRNTMAYLKFGYIRARFDSKEITDSNPEVTKSNNGDGPNYGLGLETLLCNNWSLRAEYTHTNNTSFRTDLGSNFDPSNNAIMLGLIYHFGGTLW